MAGRLLDAGVLETAPIAAQLWFLCDSGDEGLQFYHQRVFTLAFKPSRGFETEVGWHFNASFAEDDYVVLITEGGMVQLASGVGDAVALL